MLSLTLNIAATIPIDGTWIAPDRLAGHSVDDLRRRTVQHGNRRESVGELFVVEGQCDDGCIEIAGPTASVNGIGTGMNQGFILVHGSAGHHAGAGMIGGKLEIQGDASDFAGTAMRGGELRVHGSAGQELGGASPGERQGMRGGVIVVDGSTGDDCGQLMRRGLIAIRGDAGDRVGHGMIAGTVVVGGTVGEQAGFGMKRGTVVGGEALHTPGPGFVGMKAAAFHSPFLELLWRTLERLQFSTARHLRRKSYGRLLGDRLSGGQGELLFPI